MTGLTVFAAIIIGYVAILLVASVAVRPIRVKLVDLCNDLLDEGGWSQGEQMKLNRFVTTCLSFRIGGLVAFASMICLIDAISGRKSVEARAGKLNRDPRFHQILVYYFSSVLAANPIAATVVVVVIPMTICIEWLRGHKDPHVPVEDSTLRAVAIA